MKKFIISSIVFIAIISSSMQAYADMVSYSYRYGTPAYINKDGEILDYEETRHKLYDDLYRFQSPITKLEGLKDSKDEIIIKPIYKFIGINHSNRFVVATKNDKRGIININEEYIIKPIYDWISPYGNGFYIIQKNGKWGVLDKSGNIIAEPIFEEEMHFFDGLSVYKENNKYGFIDTKGNISIKPNFDYALSFSEGLAAVAKDGKWGYINTKGEWVIEPKFPSALCFYKQQDKTYWHNYKCPDTSSFHEGLAPIYYKEDSEKKYKGYINKKGEVEIKLDEYSLGKFSEGLAVVCKQKKEQCGYINKKGEWVIEPKFLSAGNFNNGIAFVKMENPPYIPKQRIPYHKLLKESPAYADKVSYNAIYNEQPAKTDSPNRHIKRIENNTNDNKENSSIPLMSILLLALIFIAGKSIKKEIKENNDKKDN